MNTNLSTLPGGVVAVLVVLAVVQLTLDVVALIDLYRRPAARVVSGNKWVWLAVILLVNLLGAILYLVVGRVKTEPAVALPAARPAPTESIADALYGPRDGTSPR
ncbi:MAG: PLD nuclease N-terminal domain-containing protein [Cellulomonas sp.]